MGKDPTWSFQHLNFGLSWKQSVKAKHCWSNQTKVSAQKIWFVLTSNVLPLHFVFSSLVDWRKNSNVFKLHIPDHDMNYELIILALWNSLNVAKVNLRKFFTLAPFIFSLGEKFSGKWFDTSFADKKLSGIKSPLWKPFTNVGKIILWYFFITP